MTRLRLFAARFFGIFGKQQSRRRLDEELAAHFECLVEQNQAKGIDSLTPQLATHYPQVDPAVVLRSE